MDLSSIPEIRVESAGDDVSYLLPVRPLGNLRWIGWLLVAVGLLFVLIPGGNLIGFLITVVTGKAGGTEGIFILFVIPFLVMGLFPIWLGMLFMWGRCRVDWREEQLTVVDYVGFLRWQRRFPKAQIRKFTVKSGGAKVNDKPVTTGPMADLAMLAAELERGKPRTVALGYPRHWLQALAQDLSRRVGASASVMAVPQVELVEATVSEKQPQLTDLAEQPAASLVRIERRPEGIMFIIPPAGVRKGSKGLFGLGVVWCVFMLVITAVAAFGTQKSGGIPWVAWLFIGAFWLIGLALLAGAINMGRRRAMLSIENGQLRIAQDGLFGAKRWSWPHEEIAAIRADASGMEVNNVPIVELQVHPLNGKKVGFFAGREEDELRWLATELRQALKAPPTPSKF